MPTEPDNPGEASVVLPDGASVVLRPIASDDKGLLTEAFDHLGPESRYRRFLGPHETLTSRELEYFTEVDHVGHEAIVALDPVNGQGVGVARYVSTDAEGSAELAVAVVDEWQGRGVGTVLLHALVERARVNGIRRFVASVLSANRPMLELLHDLGDVRVTGRDGGTSEFSVELPEQGLGPLPELLRHVAARTGLAPSPR